MTFRVSTEEREAIRAHVAEQEVPLSEYLRAAALKRRLQAPAVPAVNYQAIGELKRIGNNLNQLVKLIYMNQAPLGLLATLRTLLATLENLEAHLAGTDREEEPC